MTQLKNLEKEIVRSRILKSKKRIDGRGLSDVRPINVKWVYCPEFMVRPYSQEVKHKQ